MPVQQKTFREIEALVGDPKTKDHSEAVVFLGCGGDLAKWVEGITTDLDDSHPKTNKPIMVPGPDWYRLETSGGRIDLVMPLPDKDVDIGRMAVWKIKFGDCSWWSDYRVNYAEQHGYTPPPEFDASINYEA